VLPEDLSNERQSLITTQQRQLIHHVVRAGADARPLRRPLHEHKLADLTQRHRHGPSRLPHHAGRALELYEPQVLPDIVALVEGADWPSLQDVVLYEIQKTAGVTQTDTHIVFE